MSVDRKSLCPNCGAPLSGLEIKCPECGYVLTSETSASKGTTESILSLQEKLLAVDKVFSLERPSRKKAAIINSFPIPNTAEALIRLLHFSYSNYEAAKEAGDKKLSMAWLGKAIESYRRLSDYKADAIVSSVLNQYGVLNDKKVFAKLSGSRRRNHIFLLILALLLALVAAFSLLFDWESFLVKRGKIDTVVRYYNLRNKGEKATEFLIEHDLFEAAAKQMFSSGQLLDAVSLLAQKGFVKEALLMIGKSNNPDSIHCCIDEVSKYAIVNSRSKYNLKNNLIEKSNLNWVVYDGDEAKPKEIFNPRDSTTAWADCWDIVRWLNRPTPDKFLYSPFLRWYCSTDCRDLNHPEIKRDNLNRIEMITLGDLGITVEGGEEYVYPKGDIVFKISRGASTLIKESLSFKNNPVIEVNYQYCPGTTLLESVDYHYFIDKVPDLGTKMVLKWLRVEGANMSFREQYKYDNGNLVEVRRTWPSKKNAYEVMSLDYHDNMVIETFIFKDIHDQEAKTDAFKEISLYSNGVLVEKFNISLKDEDGLDSSITRLYDSEFDRNSSMVELEEKMVDEPVNTDRSERSGNSDNVTSNPASRTEQKIETVKNGDFLIEAPNWVDVGEQFNITFAFKGEEPITDFEAKFPDGFSIVWGPQKGTSTSVVDGKKEVTKTFTYILRTDRAGSYSFSANAKVNDQGVSFPEKHIEVIQK